MLTLHLFKMLLFNGRGHVKWTTKMQPLTQIGFYQRGMAHQRRTV